MGLDGVRIRCWDRARAFNAENAGGRAGIRGWDWPTGDDKGATGNKTDRRLANRLRHRTGGRVRGWQRGSNRIGPPTRGREVKVHGWEGRPSGVST